MTPEMTTAAQIMRDHKPQTHSALRDELMVIWGQIVSSWADYQNDEEATPDFRDDDGLAMITVEAPQARRILSLLSDTKPSLEPLLREPERDELVEQLLVEQLLELTEVILGEAITAEKLNRGSEWPDDWADGYKAQIAGFKDALSKYRREK